MIVLAVDIDIGCSAIDRSTGRNPDTTWVNITNPANDSGIIDTVEIWSWSDLENCEVAIFFVVNGNNLSTRDSVTLGTVTSGSKQTFPGLNLTVMAGDYIGIYYTAGMLECDGSGFDGIWSCAGDQIPCANITFSIYSGDAISLYGTGTTAEEEEINTFFFGTNI